MPNRKLPADSIEHCKAFRARFRLVLLLLGGKRAAAKVAGYSEDPVANWAAGKTRIPLHAAVTLCRAAGVTIGWLVDGKGEVDLDRVVARVTEPRRRAARKAAA